MNIIIIGCGRLGSTLAQELSDAGHNIAVIDRDGERLNTLGSGFNGLKIRGIEYDDEVLKEAGILDAHAVLPVTADENVNITVALTAKKIYNVPRIIARIVNPNRQYIYEKLDIETINPTQLAAAILKAKLQDNKPSVIAVIDSDYEIVEITALKNKYLTIKELEDKYKCVVSAILKNGVITLSAKNDMIGPGDKIVCTIGKKDVERLTEAL